MLVLGDDSLPNETDSSLRFCVQCREVLNGVKFKCLGLIGSVIDLWVRFDFTNRRGIHKFQKTSLSMWKGLKSIEHRIFRSTI